MASGMWKKLLRPKIEKSSSHQAFIAAYTALKPIWLEEQSKAIKLSPDEQKQISLKQNDALKTLIFNCGLNEETYSKNYPVPLLTNNDLNLELKQYEKDLDDTFRKEVGKIIPLLKENTIHGVEKYLATLDKALLSLAKTQARKDILDRLAVHYVPALIKLDKGLITSYYNQHLNNRDPDESYTLTSTFMDIIDLMERDGHRARLGEAIYPPKQMNKPIGTYIKSFENYVLRIDGIRMDSITMLENNPLNMERRRQFISGLDENIRIIVPQPEHNSEWYSFTHAYIEGYTRLYPNRSLYGNRLEKHNNHTTHHKSQFTNKFNKNNYNKNSKNNFNSTKNNDNNFRPQFKNNKPQNKFNTPSFLKTKSNNTFNKNINTFKQKNTNQYKNNMHKNYNKKQQNTKPHHTINVIESAIEKQSNILSTLAEKLSLFDVPKVTLTVVAIMTLFTPCLAWECEQIPPFYPLTYDQFEYTFSAFHKIEISEMIDICIAGEFRPVYKLGNIIIDMTTTPHIETKINDTNIDDCKPNILYTNSSNNDMFLRKPDPLTLTKDDQNILLEIYSYHRNFNYTCPSVMEVEMTIPEGKLVPTSSHRKRKRINNPDKTGDDCDELQKLADTAGERIKATNDALLLHQEMFDATKKELEMANQQISVFEDETKTAKRTIESQKNTIEQNKQTIVTITDQLAKVETSFNQARRIIESQKDELTDYKNKLIIKNDEVNSLETTIRLRDATISSLKNEIQHYNENLKNTQTTAEGAQNAALQAEQNHARQISKLRKEHETTITELERQHKLNMDNKISELTKLHNENIQNAIQTEIAKCESQRRHDAKQWNTETEKFKSECQLQRDAEIDNMKKIFDEQIKSLKNSVQFKVEAMETDDIKDGNQLLAKIEEQSKEIIFLKQRLEIRSEIKPSNSPASIDHCTAYNNFVTFIEHVKHLDIYSALVHIPSSIASLITFIMTLVGSRIVNQSKGNVHTPLYKNKAISKKDRSTRVDLDINLPQATKATWTFGDGPVVNAIDNTTHEALPKILLQLDNNKILTLIDTGASINIINNNIYKLIPEKFITHIDKGDVEATSANGSKIEIIGKVVIKLKIDQSEYSITCYISPSISHDLILGKPGLSTIGDLKISWSDAKIQLGKHCLKLINMYKLKVDIDTTLNPHTHTILNPVIENAPHLNNKSVFTIVNPRFKGNNFLATYSQISPVDDNKINFIIDNIGQNPITLTRNTLLGHVALIEHISDKEIKITNDGYSSDEADITERLPPYPSRNVGAISEDDFMNLIQVDRSQIDDKSFETLKYILWRNRLTFHEFNETPGFYSGLEQLHLHTIPHEIPKPIRAPRYTPEKEKEIEKQIRDMLAHDMIEPSRTPYLSRINLVKKKDNSWRFVVDFRAINKLIQPQSHHIPRIDSILDKASGKKFYSSLDLKNGFHQLLLDKNSRYLTGFPTHMGIFQYKRVPMGLVGSPDFFNYVIEKLFHSQDNFVYLDDILLTNNTLEDHLNNIDIALEKAAMFGLRFSLSKCLFFQKQLEYLGFLISSDGISPNAKKIAALTDKPIPKNIKELRSFLGTANYYRKHVPNYSKTAAILYDATNNFVWTTKHTEAFNNLKHAIGNACTLTPPDPNIPYTIVTDASIQGIGAALMQKDRPIAFASRTLKKSESMYAPVQLEALGLVYALKQFNPYIYGKRTTVLTDQNSLISLMTKRDVSNILDRYKNFIMGYDLDIKYIKGSDNTIADYLSRKIFNINISETTNNKFLDVFPKLSNYLQYPYIINNFTKYLNEKEKTSYPDGKITVRGKTRIFVPQLLRFMTLTLWHEHPLLGNHAGYEKGSQKFKEIFHWPAIDNDIKRIWSSCAICLKNKAHGALQAIVNDKTIPTPPHAWHTIAIDHLVISENNYILVLIDEFSKFVSMHHTTNLGTQTTINALKSTFSLIGFPNTIKTDNGPAFISEQFKQFCETFSIQHYKVSAFNHQGNGIVERFNRTIRESLRIHNTKDIKDIILFTQYVHNFSHMTNQEGKPKEYILSTVDRYINEDYTNNNLSGRRDLLHFIKNKFRENDNSTTENDNEFTYIPNNTIVFKKIQTAHKNDQQYDGPFRISEHLHGDTYLLHRITKSGRPTGQPIKSNARFLKLAPAIIQNNPNALELMTNISNPSIDEEHAPDITTENIIEPEKKKRGRPRKLPIPTEQKSHTNAPEAETHNQQPTLRKRGRPRKNNTKN